MSTRTRGFASMSKETLKIVAARGGKRTHALGHAYKFTHEKAVEAGKKGKKKLQDNLCLNN